MMRPVKPANYKQLEVADQVAHHIAVLRWNEAHPEIVKAEAEAKREKEKTAERAKELARLAEIEADTEAGRKMTAPPVEPVEPPNATHYDEETGNYIDDESDPRVVAYNLYHNALHAWSRDRYLYALAHDGLEGKDAREDIVEIREKHEHEDRREKADAEWLAKLGKREPPNNPKGVSYSIWAKAHDAWNKAHPEVIARRKAKEKAEYEAWIKEGSPEALEAAASDAECEKEMAASEAKAMASTARRIKREAKDPAAALERARVEAQHDEMDGDKDEAKADARQNGEAWGDVKEEWEADWIETNWTPEAEAEFIVSFENDWLKDHGAPFLATAEPAKPEPVVKIANPPNNVAGCCG
jgi:hypothetical protein